MIYGQDHYLCLIHKKPCTVPSIIKGKMSSPQIFQYCAHLVLSLHGHQHPQTFHKHKHPVLQPKPIYHHLVLMLPRQTLPMHKYLMLNEFPDLSMGKW